MRYFRTETQKNRDILPKGNNGRDTLEMKHGTKRHLKGELLEEINVTIETI